MYTGHTGTLVRKSHIAAVTWSDGIALEAFLNPITNLPSGSSRLNVTEKINSGQTQHKNTKLTTNQTHQDDGTMHSI